MTKRKKIGFVQITSHDPQVPHVALIEVDTGGFRAEIERAIALGENPAQALLFLANLAARHLHPHHSPGLSSHERETWEKYFGERKTQGKKPKARLTIVPKK